MSDPAHDFGTLRVPSLDGNMTQRDTTRPASSVEIDGRWEKAGFYRNTKKARRGGSVCGEEPMAEDPNRGGDLVGGGTGAGLPIEDFEPGPLASGIEDKDPAGGE